jgi:hypothetical protein
MGRARDKPNSEPEPTTCYTCGYDLKGLPPGGACPECGDKWPDHQRPTLKARFGKVSGAALGALIVLISLYFTLGAIRTAAWQADFDRNSTETAGLVIDQNRHWVSGGYRSGGYAVYSPQFLFTDHAGKEWRSRTAGSDANWAYPNRTRVLIRYRTDDPRIVLPAERFMTRYADVFLSLVGGVSFMAIGIGVIWTRLSSWTPRRNMNPLHAIARRRAAKTESLEEKRRSKSRRHAERRRKGKREAKRSGGATQDQA